MARETKHAWWDKKVMSIDPFSLMESVTIQDGGLVPQLHRLYPRCYCWLTITAIHRNLVVPLQIAEGVSITWQELIMKTPRDELQGGTQDTRCGQDLKDTQLARILQTAGSICFWVYQVQPMVSCPPFLKNAQRNGETCVLRLLFGLCANFPPQAII